MKNMLKKFRVIIIYNKMIMITMIIIINNNNSDIIIINNNTKWLYHCIYYYMTTTFHFQVSAFKLSKYILCIKQQNSGIRSMHTVSLSHTCTSLSILTILV